VFWFGRSGADVWAREGARGRCGCGVFGDEMDVVVKTEVEVEVKFEVEADLEFSPVVVVVVGNAGRA
jgi:hypothetical protein